MTPDPIFAVLSGYRAAAALKSAIELDCFSAIASGRRTPRTISRKCGGTERSVRILLDAVVGSSPGVLRKSGSSYGLTPLSRRYLVRSSPNDVGMLAGLYGHPVMWDGFRDLSAAVKAGRSVLSKDAHSTRQEFWEDFARITAAYAPARAKEMIKRLGRFPRKPEILDLACGSGAYGETFARSIPGSRVTLFDQANVVRVARKRIKSKVKWRTGDLFRSGYGGPYDIILASHVFHHFPPRQCEQLARKIAQALKPGGRLVIQEFIPDAARRRGRQALLFALTMLVWTREGDAYTEADYRRWTRGAGFTGLRRHRITPPAGLLIARKC